MSYVIALIPARGGSKGLPRKNIKLLNGKPLIAYTIEASLNSKMVDRTIVTTDDIEIASIVKELGAEVPFIRPSNLAQDDTPDYPVVEHCIEYLENVEKYFAEIIVYLRPTMPLRDSAEIDNCVRILKTNNDIDSIRTVREVSYPPFWMKKIDEKGFIRPFIDGVIPFTETRRQELPKTILCDGYVDATRTDIIKKYRKVTAGKIFAYYINSSPFVDIDTREDWDYCEFLMMKRRNNEHSNI